MTCKHFFSHSIGCLFTWLFSFNVYFCCCLCFWCHFQEIAKSNVLKLSQVFFQEFDNFRSQFRSLIYFELILIYGVRVQLHSFVSVNAFFSKHHLLKKLSFLHCVVSTSLWKVIWPNMSLFLSSILFHWCYIFLCQYHSIFITVGFLRCFEIQV